MFEPQIRNVNPMTHPLTLDIPLWKRIEQSLNDNFGPCTIEIKDLTAGHAHHQEGGKGAHGALILKSDHFKGISRPERHRMVYALLQKDFDDGTLHALSMTLKTLDDL
jgi:stress-induced morphogen